MTPLLLEHRNGSIYAVVDSIEPVRSEAELAALAAEIGTEVPVFGLAEAVSGPHTRTFMSVAFNHDQRNMIALRVFLQWRGDFSPGIEHDTYVTAKFSHLLTSGQVQMFRVQVEPDVTAGDVVDYIRNNAVNDIIEFATEDECAALELAGLAVPVAGNAADAAAAACYALKGELVNALVSTAMIFVPGFLQVGIVALRRGKGFAAARAARRAAALKRTQLVETYRRLGRRAVEGRQAQLRKLDQVGRGLPVGSLPARGSRVGQGSFTEVFLSTDGTMVIKRVKDRVGNPGQAVAVSRDEKIALARRTVEQHEILRQQGYPVPKSWVPASDPTTIVQQRAPGVPLEDLPSEVGQQARASASGLKREADRLNVEIDADSHNIARNMVFDEFGNVNAWYDPGIPLDSDQTRQIGMRIWANAG